MSLRGYGNMDSPSYLDAPSYPAQLPKVKTADKWNNPDDNVVLKSSDGKEFRVADYMLKAYSETFREILSISTDGPVIIPMSEHSFIIEVFLYTIHCPKDELKILHTKDNEHVFPHLAKLTTIQWIELCNMGDKYEVARMHQMYHHSRRLATYNDPAPAFVWGCQAKDWELAGDMLEFLQDNHVSNGTWKYTTHKYCGRIVGSMETGKWDKEMMEDAGSLAQRKLKAAWVIAKEEVGTKFHTRGFNGLLKEAFKKVEPPEEEEEPPRGTKRPIDDAEELEKEGTSDPADGPLRKKVKL